MPGLKTFSFEQTSLLFIFPAGGVVFAGANTKYPHVDMIGINRLPLLGMACQLFGRILEEHTKWKSLI